MTWKEVGFKIMDTLLGGNLSVRRLSKKVFQRVTEAYPEKYLDPEKCSLLKGVISDLIWSLYPNPEENIKMFVEIAQDALETIKDIESVKF